MFGFRNIVASNCFRLLKCSFYRNLSVSHICASNSAIKRLFPISYCLSQFKSYAATSGGPRQHENQPHSKAPLSRRDIDNYFNKKITEYHENDVKEMIKAAGKKNNNIIIGRHLPFFFFLSIN